MHKLYFRLILEASSHKIATEAACSSARLVHAYYVQQVQNLKYRFTLLIKQKSKRVKTKRKNNPFYKMTWICVLYI